MARRKKPTLWERLDDSRYKAAAIVGLFVAASFLFGTVRDFGIWTWRHFTGSEIAIVLAPQVEELRNLSTKQDARIQSNEAILRSQREQVGAIIELKEAEQQQSAAKGAVYEDECRLGNLSAEACKRLGYPHPGAAQ